MSKQRRRRLTRDQEAEANRKRYGCWQAVLAEGSWIQCGRCGKRQFRKGDPTMKKCRQCGAPLAKVGV
jgi:DNA-directed RNA polymerase subunit RPC12/RpoP